MATMSGSDGTSQCKVEPHSGQNLKRSVAPRSVRRANSLDLPSIATIDLRLKYALSLKTLPVRRWHCRQWQVETRDGSPLTLIRNWPQQQSAVRSINHLFFWSSLVVVRLRSNRVCYAATAED